MEAVKFNHEADDLSGALFISKERKNILDATIMYYIVYSALLVNKLYDNSDEAPVNLRTKTGNLERMLEHTENLEEKIYIAWAYHGINNKLEDSEKGAIAMMAFCAKLSMLDMDYNKFVKFHIEVTNMNSED